jgi:hypothetical protein
MLYVAAGGIDPKKVLPVLLDAGTDNKALRDHPWYLGLPQSRLKGDEYFSLVHEFVNAVHFRWPNAGASAVRAALRSRCRSAGGRRRSSGGAAGRRDPSCGRRAGHVKGWV